MTLNDRVIGGLAILGGVLVIAGTFDFRAIPGQQFGSAFFPRILGVSLILTGLIQVARGNSKTLLTVPDWMGDARVWRALAIPAAIIAWIWLAPQFGFLLTSAIMMSCVALAAGGRVIPSLTVAVVMTAALYLIFSVLLRVPLPRGIVEGWLV